MTERITHEEARALGKELVAIDGRALPDVLVACRDAHLPRLIADFEPTDVEVFRGILRGIRNGELKFERESDRPTKPVALNHSDRPSPKDPRERTAEPPS